MPLFDIHMDNGDVITVEHPQAPTAEEAQATIASVAAPSQPARPSSKVAPSGRTVEQEALAQDFIKSEQRPALQKVMEGALGLGQGLAKPFVAVFKALPSIPEVMAEPAKLIPTAGEAARRIGLDIINLSRMAAPQLLDQAIKGPIGVLSEQLKNLNPRTPTQAEIDKFVAQAPLEQALAQERNNVSFQGAQPQLAEAMAQITEAFPPVKGLSSLKGVSLAKASPARILRAAIKPGKQFGARVEKAAENTMSDIYHANPNADTLTAMPFEGFHQTVTEVQKQVGAQIDSGLKASGIPINAGDEMAAALTARADKLVKEGAEAEMVQVLRDRAKDLAGQVTDMESLRGSVTRANQSNSPLFQRTRESANPLRGKADTIVNEIISKVGGAVENDALASVKGPEGALLRKKWSDLNIINQEASKRLNTLINTAPAEIQSTVAGVVGSLEGAAGIVALANGFVSGIIPIATKAAKQLSNNAQKALKDSNSLVTSAYEKLRANPPVAPMAPAAPAFVYNPSISPPPPPLISPQNRLNQAIAQSIQPTPLALQVPSGATIAPNFVANPNPAMVVPPVIGSIPSQAQLAEVIKRLVEDEAARKAALLQGGNLGGAFF